MKSAIFSSRWLEVFVLRMAIKDKIQLVIKNITAATANSSMREPSVRASFFKEVSTIKQIPNKFAEVLKICGDLFSAILIFFL
ncbi:hypothetical protein [Pedobacter sp. UBA5917]|uniref:hypothetical protein n=1 Tax=Pedobacter sp. UBA5917 TaxID=1947061 RepID=UPI0025EACC0B|nr:hypothetical protein [Pedobacter sp. UBA5917]